MCRGFRVLKTLLGEGLLTAEGESWFSQRRLAQPMFHQSRIDNYGKIMVEYTDRMLQNWHDGETHDVSSYHIQAIGSHDRLDALLINVSSG